jgi:hypothetical protein
MMANGKEKNIKRIRRQGPIDPEEMKRLLDIRA